MFAMNGSYYRKQIFLMVEILLLRMTKLDVTIGANRNHVYIEGNDNIMHEIIFELFMI